jgi:hypothetical protein
MAGQQFQYDDSGNTFFYFLTSFVGLIVIPATYYLWPRDQNAGESLRRLPADPCRPRQPQRSGPPSPAHRVPVTPPVPPGLTSRRPPLAGPGLGGVSLPRYLLSPFIVRLGSFASYPLIVLDAPSCLLLPLCLLSLCFYWVSFMEGAGWDGEDGIGGQAREELAQEETERAGTTLQAHRSSSPAPRLPLQLWPQMFGGHSRRWVAC